MHDEEQACNFVWSFPNYVLVTNFDVGDDTGEIDYDLGIQFVAPFNSIGEKQVAVFSDHDSVNRWLQICDQSTGLRILRLADADAMHKFLAHAESLGFTKLWYDLNPDTRIGRTLFIDHALRELRRLL